MNKFYILLIICLSISAYAQVGVGTITPQEDLHVSGTNSEIRIEGLNVTNENYNLGGSDLYNLMVDNTGTFRLNPQSGLVSSDSNVPSPISIQSTSLSGLNSTALYQKNFTLEKRALVVITYYIAVDFMSYDGLSNVNDGRVKVAQNYFYLGDGTTEDASTSYGVSSCTYSNYSCDTATGSVYNSQSVLVTLEAGNHSIHMKGAVFGGGVEPGAAFSSVFNDGDRIDITAIYL